MDNMKNNGIFNIKISKLKINFICLYLSQAVNFVFPLLSVPYLSRVLSVEHFGVIFFSYAYVSYLGIICDYGFSITGVKDVATSRGDQEELFKKVNAIFYAKTFLLIFAICAGVLGILLIAKLRAEWFCYTISLISLIYNAYYPLWFFQGQERMFYITVINLLTKSSSLILIFLFIKSDQQYLMVIFFTVLMNVVSVIIAQLILYRAWKFRYHWPDICYIKRQLKDGFIIFISTIAISLYTTSNTFFLGVFANERSVAYYASAERIVSGVQSLLSPVTQSLFPYLAKLVHEDKAAGLAFLKKIFLRISLLTFATSSLLFVFAPDIVRLLLGVKYNDSVVILRIMAFIPFIVGMSNVLGLQTMIPLGMKKQFSKILIVGSVIDLSLIFLFVPTYGYVASAYCVVITEVVVTLLMIICLNKNGVKIWRGF